MSPGLRKFLVTTVVVLFAAMVIAIVIRGRPPQQNTTPAAPTKAPASADAPAPAAATPPAPNGSPTETAAQTPVATPPAADGSAAVTPTAKLGTLRAQPATADRAISATRLPIPLGSLDETKAPFRVDFAPTSAGISAIVFSEFWKSATSRTQEMKHRANPSIPAPPDDDRYVLATTLKRFEGGRTFEVPVLAAYALEIGDQPVILFGSVWSEEAPGHFATEIVDESGKAVARVDREYRIGNKFDIALRQTVTNLTGDPLTVRWIQYGPSELATDMTSYVDARRLQFGYLLPPDRDPAQENVLSSGEMLERAAINKQIDAKQFDLWPNARSTAGKYTLSWFASKTRYFALSVHAPWTEANPVHSVAPTIETVRVDGNGAPGTERAVLTELHSPARTIAAGSAASFDLGVFAGPLDPDLLSRVQPYDALGMESMIVYMLSSCCTWCTFAWLADGLAAFLSFLHDWVVFDWGLAIIVLVIVVRLILHPLMKRSQIQMQRFSRAMAALKPELDALQKRYAGDAQKIQQEQMRLYREKGVNPVGCVSGIVPTFLQMPIWIALYAVLFFNWELRQAPAFFGVFQLFGGWQFLGDLSRPDNFIVFPQPLNLGFFHMSGINLLPLLMGVVFFLQQKYMTPPQPNMSPEQEQQQKIMKVAMVVMFPLMMYVAPSGLTLYIMTSTCIGIWESRMVKKHIDMHGVEPVKAAAGAKKKQDTMGRMYEQMLERARQKQSDKGKKTYKERE